MRASGSRSLLAAPRRSRYSQDGAQENMSDGLLTFLIFFAIAMVAIAAYRLRGGRNSAFVTVFEWEHAIAYYDGRFDRILPPGRYFNWQPKRRAVHRLRKNDQILAVPVTDVTSADRLVYRMAATVTYRFIDPREALENGYSERLKLAVATALSKLAANRSLEEFLVQRVTLDAELLGLIGSPISGCEVIGATVTSLVLPPEIRRLFSEVERARLEGAAALERARGEQAALRSLANAARMLKGNPELMNLRLLQTLSGKNRTNLVLGSNAILPVGEGGGEQIVDG